MGFYHACECNNPQCSKQATPAAHAFPEWNGEGCPGCGFDDDLDMLGIVEPLLVDVVPTDDGVLEARGVSTSGWRITSAGWLFCSAACEDLGPMNGIPAPPTPVGET